VEIVRAGARVKKSALPVASVAPLVDLNNKPKANGHYLQVSVKQSQEHHESCSVAKPCLGRHGSACRQR
jgi:hypothetical protein